MHFDFNIGDKIWMASYYNGTWHTKKRKITRRQWHESADSKEAFYFHGTSRMDYVFVIGSTDKRRWFYWAYPTRQACRIAIREGWKED